MSLNTKHPPKIHIDGNNLMNTNSSTYLGSIVTNVGGAEEDIKARLGKARSAFTRLKNIWKSTSISRKTKMRLHSSCVLPVLLYDAECWRMTEKDINKRSSFHNGCLRRILKIFWPVKISIENLHEITNSTNMRTILKRYRWEWIGHVLRKPTNNITRVSLRWTPEGKRKQDRPKTTWRKTVESEMKEIG